MLSVDSLSVAEEEVVESSSSRLGDIYAFVAEGSYPQAMNPIRKKNLKRYAQKFMLDDGRLYYVGPKKEEKREVVIEAERKRQIFLECHFNDTGHHLGQKKTVHRIQSKYYWLGIVKDVVDWIKVCETCQHTERNKNMTRTVRPMKVDGPWEIVAVEIMGPFPGSAHGGNTHIVIVTDYYSKWVEVFPVQKKDSLCVARCISSSIYRYTKKPRSFALIIVDICFLIRDFVHQQIHLFNQTHIFQVTKHLHERWNVSQKVSAAEPPQRNALYDHGSALLRDAIKQLVAERQVEWADFLEQVVALFRTAVNPATKFTPYFLMFNRKASVPGEMKLDLLSYEQRPGGYTLSEEADSFFLSTLQEHQSQLKQTVFSNMNAAYKQEKKSAKRRSRNISSITLTVTEPLCPPDECPSPKKLRDGLFLTFPVETVLGTVQAAPEDRKNGLEYPLH